MVFDESLSISSEGFEREKRKGTTKRGREEKRKRRAAAKKTHNKKILVMGKVKIKKIKM